MKVKKRCIHCGKKYYIWKGYADNARYCSQFCRVESGEYSTRSSLVTKICHACGKKYEVQKYRSKKTRFCSHYCQNHGQYGGWTKICKGCSKEFEVTSSRSGQKYCSSLCRSLDPERKTQVEYRREAAKRQRLYYGVMDGGNLRKYLKSKYIFQCQACKYNEHDFCIDIHHADKNPNNNKMGNILLLCTICHRKIHHGFVLLMKKKQRLHDII